MNVSKGFKYACISVFIFLVGRVCATEIPDYTFQIHSYDEFKLYAGAPLSKAFSGVSAVKLVYALDDKKLYFVQSQKYPLHYTFCKGVLGDQSDLELFNTLNYSSQRNRLYLLATLNYFKDASLYAIEFSPADEISRQEMELVYSETRRHFFDTAHLYIQSSSGKTLAENQWGVPVLSSENLYKKQKLQIIQQGVVSGRLVKVEADTMDRVHAAENDILVIHGSSNTIPFCKGIITTDFQTPLSHISVLSQNRNTPLLAFRDAWVNVKIDSLVNTQVLFTLSEDTFRLESSAEWLNNAVASVSESKEYRLFMDTAFRVILPLNKIKMKETGRFGVKAANLSELSRIRYKGKLLNTPENSFAIPIAYYWQHIRHYGIDKLIHQLGETGKESFEKQSILLKLISDSILNSPVDPDLISAVEQKLRNAEGWKRFRFRSSSNAEDLKGFNGAGLYTSETVVLKSKSKTIERAIKLVWASLWTSRVFNEREHAHINQTSVGMAILVHRAFPEEEVNGVAITRNLYRDFDFGFVINAQLGDENLVRPDSGVTCEQFISYFNSADPFFNQKQAVEYISFSSLNNNNLLLTTPEIYTLTQQLNRIKNRFYWKTGAWRNLAYKDFAMDVEFKVESRGGQRTFYFKQARPFN